MLKKEELLNIRTNTIRAKMIPKVLDHFAKHGCILLDSYRDDRTKVNFICKCGNKGYKSYDKFRYRPYCIECGKNSFKGSNNTHWNPDLVMKRKIKMINITSAGKLKLFWNNITGKTTASSVAKFGYGPVEFQNYIKNHPNFKNITEKLSFDHIFPIKAFIEHGIEDLTIINHLSNIQPIEFKDNMKKGHAYNKTEFYAWLDSINYTDYNKQSEDK